jgi:dTMP kinase
MNTERAPFIVLEGIDGCGETSAVKAIAKRFQQVHTTRDPGGTFLAERIRDFLLSEKGAILSLEEQMTQFFAARQISISEVIDRKRGEGVPVISDRFDSSTFAFQKWYSWLTMR